MATKILIVDDEPEARQVLRRILRHNLAGGQYAITGEVSSGEEALDILRSGVLVQAILMDVELYKEDEAGMDGITSAAAIQKEFPLIPVVFMTGHSEEEIAQRIGETVAQGYILKDAPVGAKLAQLKLALTTAHQRLDAASGVPQKLRAALEQKELTVFFQPIVLLQKKEQGFKIEGAEALVRWIDTGTGKPMYTPNEFVPIAERNGLISELGLFVLGESCRIAKECEAILQGIILHFHVNVSGVQLQNHDFPEQAQSLIANAGLQTSRVVLEVTESVAQDSNTLGVIKAFVDTVFAMDDYGVGYSGPTTLAQAQELWAGGIKVDRFFLADKNGRLLLPSMVSGIQNLRLEAVVEGIENPEDVALLQSLGVRLAQGFYFARPMPGEEFKKLLKEGGGFIKK